MSSLGTKIKEALTGSGPHSDEAAKGEVDRRTPGSFPTDDVPQQSAEGHTTATADTTSSSSQHNKLHKPNDPRGWSDSDQTTGAQGHTDTGVGLPQHGNDTLYTSRGATAPTTTTQHDNSGTTREGLGSTAAAAGTTGLAAHQASGHHQHQDTSRPSDSTLGAQTQHGDSLSTGSHWHTQPGGSHTTQHGTSAGTGLAGAAVPATHKHDQDGLVGSGNKTASAPNTDAPYWGDIPHGTGVYNTVTGHGSAEDEQHHHGGQQHGTGTHGTTHDTTRTTSSSTEQRAFPLGSTSKPHGDETRNPHESRFREGAAGVGAGAGVGLAAHELQKKHEQRDDQRNLDKDTKHTSTDPAKEHDSKLAALFHRGDKHEKESKHEVKEEKPKHHKEEKDSKFAGLVHRDHPDDKELKHEKQEKDKQSRHTDEATAAAAAAYAAHSTTDDKHKHHDKDDTAQPKEKKESKLAGLFHRSSKDKDDEPTKEHHAQKHHEPAAVSTTNPETRDYTTRAAQHDATQPQSAKQPGETVEKKQSDYAPGIAAAGAGGAATYGAYKLGHKDDDKHHDTTRSGHDQPYAAGTTQGYPSAQGHSTTQGYPTSATTQGYPSTQGHSTTQGYPATQGYSTAQGSNAPQGYGASHQPTSQSGYTGSQHGHHDQYNVLPTGTTSGVNTTGTSGPAGYGSGAGSTPQTTRDTTGHSDHTGAKYGAAGAAAAGLGAAAYQSHAHDKSRDTASTQQGQNTYPSAISNPPPASGYSAPVAGHSSTHPSSSPTDTRYGQTTGGVSSHTPSYGASGQGTQSAIHPTTGSSGDGKYNTLSSGTTSGITSHSSSHATSGQDTHPSTQPTTSSSGDGKYNTLSSGTPSGVAIDDNKSSSTTGQSGVPGSHHDNNYESKAAVAGAGAAGAGTAAYLASRGDDKPTQQTQQSSELQRKPVADDRQTSAAGGAPIPPVAGGGKVIHKCQKCGEDNDISQYFKK